MKSRIEGELYRESWRLPHYKYLLACTFLWTWNKYTIELIPHCDAAVIIRQHNQSNLVIKKIVTDIDRYGSQRI